MKPDMSTVSPDAISVLASSSIYTSRLQCVYHTAHTQPKFVWHEKISEKQGVLTNLYDDVRMGVRIGLFLVF